MIIFHRKTFLALIPLAIFGYAFWGFMLGIMLLIIEPYKVGMASLVADAIFPINVLMLLFYVAVIAIPALIPPAITVGFLLTKIDDFFYPENQEGEA